MSLKKSDLSQLLEELIELQERKVYQSALRIIPHLTKDDILQPNDFPELEYHPYFRYEEGILEGLRSAKAALLGYVSNPTS